MKILVIFGWVIFRGRGVFFDDRGMGLFMIKFVYFLEIKVTF